MTIKISKFINFIKNIFAWLENELIIVYAAQASFFWTISFVPLIMLSIQLLQYIIPVDKYTLTELFVNFIPQDNQIFVFFENIIDEIFGKTNFPIVSITAITLLWSASKGIRSISRCIINIYGKPEETNFIKYFLFSFIYTIIFIIVLISAMILILFGRKLEEYTSRQDIIIYNILRVIFNLKSFISFIILILIFVFAYRGMAGNKLHVKFKFRYHIAGAVFSAAGWLVFSFFYTIYIDKFSNYSYIYGSLTAIILLMLWLYFCIIIFLLGAKINVLIYEKYAVK